MVLPVLANVGTSLRLTDATLQRLDAPDFIAEELESINKVKAKSAGLMQALDSFSAGGAPAPETGPVLPTGEVLDQSNAELFFAMQRLDVVTPADLPDRFNEFEVLRNRIKGLRDSVALAARR